MQTVLALSNLVYTSLPILTYPNSVQFSLNQPNSIPPHPNSTLIFPPRLEKLAEAARNRTMLEAEAEAEAIRVKGEAEAYAVEAKAKAEAIIMIQKAEAQKEYKDAAMLEMFLDTLPKVYYLTSFISISLHLIVSCCSIDSLYIIVLCGIVTIYFPISQG